MGTRGAYGFRLNGKDKLTYNHFDSYPSCLGDAMIGFVKRTDNRELRRIANRLVLVDEQDTPSRDMIAYYSEHVPMLNLGVSSQRATDWYCLLRGAQGEPMCWKEGVNHMIDSHGFMYDSLFCEWAYIINLDEETLEVYKGFNKSPKGVGRYALPPGERPNDSGYFGVSLIAKIDLDEVRQSGTDELIKAWE